MKNITYLFLFLILGVVSCELPDNVNPKAASEVEASALFINAEVALVNHLNNTSVNTNITRFFAQYWTETTYFDEARYLMTDRNIPNGYWQAIYRDVLADLADAKKVVPLNSVISDEVKTNQTAIIEILEAYAWHVLVDGFGNIPYSEALGGIENTQPVYDDAASIYTSLLSQLTSAISALDDTEASFGASDLIYNGDVASWRTFAASLKLRLAMRLADYDDDVAGANVEAAVLTGVFGTGESATLNYIGVSPHVSAIHTAFIVNGRKDFLPTSQIIEPMKTLSDPRLPLWFTMVDTSTVAGTSPSVYWGAEYGKDGAQSYNNFSHFAAPFFEATFPAVLMDYMEVEFLLAEAVERGYAVGGTAEEHYDNAVTASITGWGGTNGEANAYLAQTEVAYSTATGTWQQKIGEQKWFGLYNRGSEAWAEWRRLDYPILTPPEGLTYADIPVRFFYPIREGQLNGDNKDAAATAIGGDDISTRVFWDIN